MARSVYLTGLEAGSGKSAVALGVAELLSRRVERLGAFRPLSRGERAADDPVLALLRARYPIADEALGTGLTYERAEALVGAGRQEELLTTVVERYRAVERGCDAVIVVGTDFGRDTGEPHGEYGLPDELALNLRLAGELGAPVLAVMDGRGRGAADLDAATRTAYHTLAEHEANVVAIVTNRVSPEVAGAARGAAGRAAGPGVRGAGRSRRLRPHRRRGAHRPRRRSGARREPGGARPGRAGHRRRRGDRVDLPGVPLRRVPGGDARRPGRSDHRRGGGARLRAGRRRRRRAHARPAAGPAGRRPAQAPRAHVAGAVRRPGVVRHRQGADRAGGPAHRRQPAQGRRRARRVRVQCGHGRAGQPAGRDPLRPGHPADVRVRPDRTGPRRPAARGAARGHRGAHPARRRDRCCAGACAS